MTADVDIKRVEQAFADMAKAGKNLRGFWWAQRRSVIADLRSHFVKREGPTGNRWPGYSAAYQERAKRRKNLALAQAQFNRAKRKRGKKATRISYANMLGKIKTSWHKNKAFQDGLETTNAVPFSSVHDRGGHVGRGRRVRLFARPFAWLSQKLLNRVARRGLRHLMRRWPK
ncbi:MAG: hypothetical protein V2A73_14775 [Pseudomonadota bacterium]